MLVNTDARPGSINKLTLMMVILINITFLGVNHALCFAAFDELAKKRLPLTENDFLEVLYKASERIQLSKL